MSARAALVRSVDGQRGVGRAPAHHGEILQGAFDMRGHLERGLVSLPCPMFASEVRATLHAMTREITASPPGKVKARAAARRALDVLELRDVGAHLDVHCAVPVGRGFGSSTSDVVASIRAIADAAGGSMTEAAVAKLAVAAETASDASMFQRPVLFGQRIGIALEHFDGGLPAMVVLGFSTSADGRGVSTLGLSPAPYAAADADRFEQLRGQLRRALLLGDIQSIGNVMSASAWINQRHLPISRFEGLDAARRAAGAVGVQVAHSGDIAGFVFDAEDQACDLHIRDARERLARLGVKRTWRFRLPFASENQG